MHGANALLIESEYINSCLVIDNMENNRIVSIKPGHAMHYIKKLSMSNHMDLPSVFWQAEFQIHKKIFLFDECEFPYHDNSLIFLGLGTVGNNIVIKNVIVTHQNNYPNHLIRLFFTINDSAIMVVANKLNHYELDKNVDVQEIIVLSPEAKHKYEEHYISLKNSIPNHSVY